MDQAAIVARGDSDRTSAAIRRLGARVPGLGDLTADETQVLKRYAQGYLMRQIALETHLDIASVEQRKTDGMLKLGFKTRADVAQFAATRGWISSA